MNNEAQVAVDGQQLGAGVLDIQQDWIEIRMLAARKPDPDWVYVDRLGHWHAWDDENNLPTLDRRKRPIHPANDEPDEDDDDPDDDFEPEQFFETFYACRICAEEIEPQYVPDNPDKTIPGRRSWTVEVDHALTHGKRVSVVVQMSGRTVFGIGTVTDVKMAAGLRPQSTIHGAGSLGIRTGKSARRT